MHTPLLAARLIQQPLYKTSEKYIKEKLLILLKYLRVSSVNCDGPHTQVKDGALSERSVLASIDWQTRPLSPAHCSSGSDRTCHISNLAKKLTL